MKNMYELLEIPRISDISILQLLFPVYPTNCSSGCSFALWNRTAGNSSCPPHCQAGCSQCTSPSADRDTEHCCPSAPSWMWKRVLQPPKANMRKTHWSKSKAFGDVQCGLCCRAPQGCGCSSNTQGLTDTGCRQAQLLFRPPSPIRMHLNSSPYHLSSLTSSVTAKQGSLTDSLLTIPTSRLGSE